MNDETTPRRLGLQRETRHDTEEEVSARGVCGTCHLRGMGATASAASNEVGFPRDEVSSSDIIHDMICYAGPRGKWGCGLWNESRS